MMPERNGRLALFKLSMSEAVAHQIKAVIEEATSLGLGAAARAALLRILARIRKDPLDVGELRNAHANLNLLVHVVVDLPVVVHFAINPDQKFVIIQKVFLAPSGSQE